MPLSDQQLSQLYDRYAPAVYHRCLRILKDPEDARDATQEVFARILRHGERFRGEASPMTFMYKIATNHCLNQLRNRSGRADKRDARRAELQAANLAGPADHLDHQMVRAILDEVDDQTRRCVLYTYFDECTRQEVADLVGLSVPTVRKRLQQFLQRARRRFGVPDGTVALINASAVLLVGALGLGDTLALSWRSL